jgi:hypothetical protein
MVCLFYFLTLSNFGGCNFLNSNLFLTIFSAPNAPIRRVQVFLNTKNNGALLLDPACLEHLSVHSLAVLPYKKSQTDFEDEVKIKLNYVVRMGHYWNNGLLPKMRTKMKR